MKKWDNSVFWFGAVIYAVILTGLNFSAYWPRPLWWAANMVQIIPLWIWGIPLLGLAAAAVFSRDVKLLVLSSGLAALLLLGIMGWRVPLVPAWSAQGPQIRVATLNLGRGTRREDFIRLMKVWQPDIVVFQEADGDEESFIRKTFPSPEWNVHFQAHLGVASKFQIQTTEAKSRRPLGGWGEMVRRYELNTPWATVQLFDVHLATPRAGVEAMLKDRWKALKAIRQVTEKQEKESSIASDLVKNRRNVIVAGDFNMSINNPIYHAYWSGLADSFAKAGSGFGYTKFTRYHGVRIDHILTDNSWRVRHCRVGPDIGSDHRPLMAELVFTGERSLAGF